jgi:ParB-like chromosome segregation protein Spo0J
MRPESFEAVRRQRDSGAVAPIEVAVYAKEGAVLTDGRHRLAVAKQEGDTEIDAIVRHYGPRGGLLRTQRKKLRV